MSSYHSSFSYLNKNSYTNCKWLVVHFDADSGETDGFMSQEQIYDETYRGTKRIVYGTKWTSVAEIKITVIKQDGTDFTLQECRDAYKWLTGSNKPNWLNLYDGDKLLYSFLATNSDVKPQKLDSRTVGLNIYFESISPWAYSPVQYTTCTLGQRLTLTESGALTLDNSAFSIDADGIVPVEDNLLSIDTNGVVFIDNSVKRQINNKSDDLYTYVYLDTKIKNINSDEILITNITLGEVTRLSNMTNGEIITLNSGQFVTSNLAYNKIFGDDFNWVWPKLGPGVNNFVISSSGQCTVEFSYRYPMKIGDMAIDGGEINCF
jgi:hypothetical protein